MGERAGRKAGVEVLWVNHRLDSGVRVTRYVNAEVRCARVNAGVAFETAADLKVSIEMINMYH